MAKPQRRRAAAGFLADLILRHRDGRPFEVLERVVSHFRLSKLDALRIRTVLVKKGAR